ncbi:MAG: HD domain-containing protein [Proteobacteria bacterium]|nr:HD domain-containing protein [Pseudomonadota bacterium]
MDSAHHPDRRTSDHPTPLHPASTGALLVDLRHVIYALSDALDLVGIDDVGHGKRVGIMAAACGRTLGLSEAETTFLFDLGMLHDIGVSSTKTHGHLVAEFDWKSSQVHCEVGYALLRDFVPLAAMALPIRYHHSHWDKLRDRSDLDPAIAGQANLVFLVDRVDALSAAHYADGSLMTQRGSIRDQIKANAGSFFAPELVEAFLAASASEAFWLQLEPRGIQAIMQDMLARHEPCAASTPELKQLAEIFSLIVDAKSSFTAEHSLGVARLSRHIAERMGISPENCDKIEIAGLLHDLGKLRIPDGILDKPGKLDEHERNIINAHSFETFQILRNIKGFEEITPWAAYHHEQPDGGGYPFHIRNIDLPLEARILRVADIFQAMAQNRPYRKGLSADAILVFFEDLVAQGRIEAGIVTTLTQDMPAAMAAALPGNTLPPIQTN